MLVLDANVFVTAATSRAGFGLLDDQDLLGPPLLWSEALSALHTALWRRLISDDLASHALSLLQSDQVRERRHPRLQRQAWAIADHLGWAKTYDAEYLALAQLLRCDLATFDRRMQNAAQQLGVGVQIPR